MGQADRTELERLERHLTQVEIELARYAAAYGLSDQARMLLIVSPLAQTPTRPVMTGQAQGASG
jgi:hypothetical protein